MRLGPEVLGVDLYGVLGVKQWATPDEIRRAYRRLAAANHPDRNRGDPWAEQRMAAINVAAGVLLHPDRRTSYDRQRVAAANGGARHQDRNRARSESVPFGASEPGDWAAPPKVTHYAVGADVAELVLNLRTRPERWMNGIDAELRSWSKERHGLVFAACTLIAFALVGCARPRSLTELFASDRAPVHAARR
jgi:curved DNA-binding protein CbpA